MNLSRAVVVLAALLLIVTQTAAGQNWGSRGVSVHLLPEGFNVSGYAGVNNKGQVAGYMGGQSQAVIVSADRLTPEILPTLGGYFNTASAVNDAGDVVGYASTSSGDTHGFLYSGGVMRDLGALGGNYSAAYGINNAGQVVGVYSMTTMSPTQSFMYDAGTEDIRSLGGFYALGMNDMGSVTGFAGIYRPVIYRDGNLLDLSTVGLFSGAGYAINNAGQVTGYAAQDGGWVGFVYDESRGVTFVRPEWGTSSVGTGIDEKGRVVGHDYAGMIFRAALWEPNASGYEEFLLDDIVKGSGGDAEWSFSFADGISADGRYVFAQGNNPSVRNGADQWVILEAEPNTVTPEPVSIALLGTGLFGVGVARKRKKRKSDSRRDVIFRGRRRRIGCRATRPCPCATYFASSRLSPSPPRPSDRP